MLLWIGLLACGPRAPTQAAPRQACTLTPATLPGSTWHRLGETADGPGPQADHRLQLSSGTARLTHGEHTRLYTCVAEDAALSCSTPPDALAWCRARLANRLGCALGDIQARAPMLSERSLSDAIAQAAEEHALVAGTPEEAAFSARYARPEAPLQHTLQVSIDAAQCRLQLREQQLRAVGGEWTDSLTAEATYIPAPLPEL